MNYIDNIIINVTYTTVFIFLKCDCILILRTGKRIPDCDCQLSVKDEGGFFVY